MSLNIIIKVYLEKGRVKNFVDECLIRKKNYELFLRRFNKLAKIDFMTKTNTKTMFNPEK